MHEPVSRKRRSRLCRCVVTSMQHRLLRSRRMVRVGTMLRNMWRWYANANVHESLARSWRRSVFRYGYAKLQFTVVSVAISHSTESLAYARGGRRVECVERLFRIMRWWCDDSHVHESGSEQWGCRMCRRGDGNLQHRPLYARRMVRLVGMLRYMRWRHADSDVQ